MNKSRRRLWALALLAGAAALGLHLYPLVRPMIIYDDFQILARSRTWETAWSNLWWSANEHVMPLGRLLTAAWVEVATGQTALPRTIALQGPLALVVALALLFLFLSRELGHPLYGLVGMIFFGVTSIYHQAVGWFAASFSLLCLDQILLALLAAQRWQRTGCWRWLIACTLSCFLAPAWFASGILAGPLCVLYLLYRGGPEKSRVLFLNALPLVGPLVFLALALPRSAGQILHLRHYDGKTTWQVFDPLLGVWYTARSLVDNLGLGQLGISGVACPPALVAAGLLGWVVLITWWWRPVQSRRLLWLGLAFILSSYVLTYSARAFLGYEEANMTQPVQGRYHLLPQLGLALLVCGALTRWQDVRFHLEPDGGLSRRQARTLAWVVGVLFIIHLPRGLIGSVPYESQESGLKRLERAEALCRMHHISAATARAVLPPFALPLCHEEDNAWELLRGSDTPEVLSIDQARALLLEDQADPKDR